MSTRCTIQIFDPDDMYYIYRHCDGYPHGRHGVPATLAEALPYAWPFPRFEASDFAAAIIRAWKKEGGGNVYFTQGHDCHADTEYQYNVTTRDGKLRLSVEAVGWMDGGEQDRKRRLLFEGLASEAIQYFVEWKLPLREIFNQASRIAPAATTHP